MGKAQTSNSDVIPKVRFSLAERLANKLLKELGNPSPPIPVDEIVKRNGWLLEYGDLKGPDGYMAKFEIQGKPFFAIRVATDIDQGKYSPKTIIRRQLWTIAHEIGHVVLHGDFLLNTIGKSNLAQKSASNAEVEANWFAEKLLMPDYVFQSADDLIPELLSQKCNVNIQAAQKRLKHLDRNQIIDNYVRSKTNIVPLDALSVLREAHLEIASAKQDLLPKRRKIMKQENDNKFASIPTDLNQRFLFCPQCNNEEFSESAIFCKMCGFHLFNHCTNGHCSKINSGDARFCEECGEDTKLFSLDYLMSWQEIVDAYENVSIGLSKNNALNAKSKEREIIINDDDLPF